MYGFQENEHNFKNITGLLFYHSQQFIFSSYSDLQKNSIYRGTSFIPMLLGKPPLHSGHWGFASGSIPGFETYPEHVVCHYCTNASVRPDVNGYMTKVIQGSLKGDLYHHGVVPVS